MWEKLTHAETALIRGYSLTLNDEARRVDTNHAGIADEYSPTTLLSAPKTDSDPSLMDFEKR